MTHPRPPVDLRSDTVTRPTRRMREAMAAAEVGDDVYGEDPTVLALQAEAAELLGHEAALFMPSGTMANQVAIHLHTRPGDEVVVEATAHSYDWELGAMAVLSGVQPRVVQGDRGELRPASVAREVEARPEVRSRVALVIVENTHNMAGGRLVPQESLEEVSKVCAGHGVAVHLDGARLMNAVVASGRRAAELAGVADTVAVSLSKGLCAPAGSLLAGPAALIDEARRIRKLFGGGMRQVGILAAAGRLALAEMVDRLAEDHAKARRLAEGLLATGRVELAFGHVDTNIVVVDVRASGLAASELCERAADRGVLCLPTSRETVRLVTHRDVSDEQVDEAVEVLQRLLETA